MRKRVNDIDTMIAEAGWFKGTDAEWRALPLSVRDDLAFKATGCQVAYATWAAPVECLHTSCRIRRGELPAISLTNAILRGEAESGWLRFSDRKTLAATFRAYRSAARATGIYDPWKIPGGWNLMVASALA